MEGGRPARRGRPPLEDEAELSSGPQTRQQRMRLAQRAYRARRQEAQEIAKNRNEELNRSLDNALAAYSQLHERILGSLQLGDSTGIRRHLNDAAAQMATIASGANKAIAVQPVAVSSSPVDSLGPGSFSSYVDSEGSTSSSYGYGVSEGMGLFPDTTSTPSDHLGETSRIRQPTSKRPTARAVISLRTSTPSPGGVPPRIARACLQRTVSMLSGYSYDQPLAPTLTIPLQLLGQDGLMANSLQLLSYFQASVADFHYPVDSAARAPRLFRAMEGGVGTVPRASAPSVQQIAPGKTRTLVQTHFSPLQGEWMEAVDVEEYLEERGISLRNAINSEPDSAYPPPFLENEKRDPISDLPGPDAQRREVSIDLVTSRVDPTGRSPVVALSADFRGHEAGDYSIFERPQTHQTHTTIPIRSATDPWAVPSVSQSGVEEPRQNAQDVSEITVDLDRLVHLLADKAVCLGPVPGIRKEAVDESIRGSIISAQGV
ncbi:hypothetical protein B0T11DRAFT_294363 [Plectosphaerella cucumerina]|uniref:BZIP domain-containing protein n=1 Tax=Plectosphaerella cucumerina TaxID=40658 RepID=A0A8K0X9F4_9PEZI|nr:hypothetical protein B0T11DRAFT_294363 [Plectosphaerella cucumerina]